MGKKNGGSSLSPVTYDDDLPLAGGRRVDPQRRKRCLVCASCSLIVGVVLLLGGILTIWVLFPVATEVLIYESIDLKEGSDAWDAWVEPPVPVFFNYVFMHVENPDEYRQGLARPRVKEAGPYAFREIRMKQNILEVNGDQLRYGEYYEYHYDQAETNRLGCFNPVTDSLGCTKDDTLTLLNPVLTSIVHLLKPGDGINVVQRTLYNNLVDALNGDAIACRDCQDELFIQVSPIDLLFDGYPFKTLAALEYAIKKTAADLITFRTDVTQTIRKKLQVFDHFGLDAFEFPKEVAFLAGKNASTSSYYTINNGRIEPNKLLTILEYDGGDTLPETWWPSSPSTPSAAAAGEVGICRNIYGNDGTQLPPYPKEDEKIWLFVSDLCRSIWLDYMGETEYKDIECFEYRPSDAVFDMHNPDNYCFCPTFEECAVPDASGADAWDTTLCDETCKDGMIRVSGCLAGAPIIMSAPHFLRGDEELVAAVDGLEPSVDLHDTVLLVEKMTGLVLLAHKRIMINIELLDQADSKVNELMYYNPVVFPLMWADETAELDDENEQLYIDEVVKPTRIVTAVASVFGIALGTLVLLMGVCLCWIG